MSYKQIKNNVKQIKELNSVYKDDYMKLMLSENNLTTKYLDNVKEQVQDAADQAGDLEMQIEDLNDNWNAEIQHINDKMKESAIKTGVIKNKQPYQFKEFNITDTYYDKASKKVCYKCSQGKNCPLHKL